MATTEDAVKTLQSKVYRLVKPYQIEETVVERELRRGEVAVKPILGSICHADLRYYTGNRRPEALAQKLPMALIHEGIGEIVDSAAEEFAPGQKVVIIPNIPGDPSLDKAEREKRLNSPETLEDNYSEQGKFLASGTDGIAQSLLIMPALCVAPIPEGVPEEIAVLAELTSVSHQAIHRVKHRLPGAKVAVFGDGPVGYITASLLHYHFGLPTERLRVFGAVPEKLSAFDFAVTSNVNEYDFRSSEKVDLAIECTGGKFSSAAINQAIDVLRPGGGLVLLGVTEELVPINTRDILEKGITVLGSSRSSFRDYPPVLEAMKNPAFQEALRKLLPEERHEIRTAADFDEAMKQTSETPRWKKTLLQFHW